MATRENLSEINEVINKLEKAVSSFSKRDRKGLLLTKAAAPVRKELRSNTKVRDRRNRRVNIVGGRRYKPGNLKRSMKTLTKLRRSPSVFVGPDFGKTAKEGADGYYFAMAYGSKSRYLNQLLIPSARQSERASIEAFRKDFAKRFGTRAAQQKLNVS
jgi:hypothetical protein